MHVVKAGRRRQKMGGVIGEREKRERKREGRREKAKQTKENSQKINVKTPRLLLHEVFTM